MRRVVLGDDGTGRSTVTHDDDAHVVDMGGGYRMAQVWKTASAPATTAGTDSAPFDDGAFAADLEPGGTRFMVVDFPPGQPGPPFMHSTSTVDYLVVLAGRVTLVLDSGEIELREGDTAVQRANVHGWRNDSDGVCRVACVCVDARPLAAEDEL
jgi:quercetin dioxygenase-like cupin family protein